MTWILKLNNDLESYHLSFSNLYLSVSISHVALFFVPHFLEEVKRWYTGKKPQMLEWLHCWNGGSCCNPCWNSPWKKFLWSCTPSPIPPNPPPLLLAGDETIVQSHRALKWPQFCPSASKRWYFKGSPTTWEEDSNTLDLANCYHICNQWETQYMENAKYIAAKW